VFTVKKKGRQKFVGIISFHSGIGFGKFIEELLVSVQFHKYILCSCFVAGILAATYLLLCEK